TSGSGAKQDQPILDNAIRFYVQYEYADPTSPTNGTSIVSDWYSASSSVVPSPSTQLPRAFHLRLGVIDRRYATRAASILGSSQLSQAELTKIPYNIPSMSNTALSRTMKEGFRMFFRTVYPRNAS